MKRTINKTIGVLLVSVIIGCSTTTNVEVERPLVAHPTMPKAVKPIDITVKTIIVEDKPYVAMTMEDSQKMRVYMEDMLRYIKSVNDILCVYREELQENFCTTVANDKKQ